MKYIVYTIDEVEQVCIGLESNFEKDSENNGIVSALAYNISTHDTIDEARNKATQDALEIDEKTGNGYTIHISSPAKAQAGLV